MMDGEEKVTLPPKYSKLLTVDIKNLAEAFVLGMTTECIYNFSSNELIVNFPEEFVRSNRRKFVKVLNFKFIERVEDPSYIPDSPNAPPAQQKHYVYSAPNFYGIHSDFVQDFEKINGENYVCNSNETLTSPLTYEQYTSKPSFKLFIVDEVDGKRVILSNKAPMKKVENDKEVIDVENFQRLNFQANLRLLLEY